MARETKLIPIKSGLIIYTDGGSRGNPGPSAIGVVIKDAKETLYAEIGKTIGRATNNIAEYTAVLEAFSFVLEQELFLEHEKIDVYMDSELLCRQLKGIYKVKSPHLAQLLTSIKQKEKLFSLPVSYHHIPRAQNKRADQLVNLALDGKI